MNDKKSNQIDYGNDNYIYDSYQRKSKKKVQSHSKKKKTPAVIAAFISIIIMILKWFKNKKNSEIAIPIIAVVLALSVSFGGYYLLKPKTNSTDVYSDSQTKLIVNQDMSVESSKKIAIEYVKEISLYNYNKAKKYELIPTKTLYEKMYNKDFESYVEPNQNLMEEMFGKGNKITFHVKQIGAADIKNSEISSLEEFLKIKSIKSNLKYDRLICGKVVSVMYSLSTEKQTRTDTVSLYILLLDGKWRVIDKSILKKYNQTVGTVVPDSNNFANDDDYFN